MKLVFVSVRAQSDAPSTSNDLFPIEIEESARAHTHNPRAMQIGFLPVLLHLLI